MRRHPAVVASSLAALLGAAALAAVDVEVRNGDKLTGTLSPATETETIRFRVPKGALITVKAAAAKKPLQLRLVLKDPNGATVAGPVEGKSAAVSKKPADMSGLYSVEVASKDGVAGGDYTFAATWKSPTSFGGKRTLAAGVPLDVEFSADSGAVTTFTVKKAKKSDAAPTLVSWTDAAAVVQPLDGATQKRTISASGGCEMTVSSATDGDVTATVKVKPPKPSRRKYALTSKAIGAGDAEGDAAFSAIVGPEGGTIAFPAVGPDEPGAQLDGTTVTFPPGALPVGTSILIATAPDIPTTATQSGAGATVAFGPEGLTFGTKADPKSATVTIPFDASFGAAQDQVTIYTRDAKGAVTAVAKPYTFDLVAGTVSFATSHFSSFRAVGPSRSIGGPGGGNFTTVATITDPRDICQAFDPSTQGGPRIELYVAEGTARTVGALRNPSSPSQPGFVRETYVGGGSTTTLPADRLQYQFQNDVTSVFTLPNGTLFVATTTQVLRVDPSTGVVSLVAGTGAVGDGGDNLPPFQATFTSIRNVVVDLSNTVYICDEGKPGLPGGHRIRFIQVSSIHPWAGDGSVGVTADGGPPLASSFIGPSDMQFAPNGGMYVADGARIRLINPFNETGPVNQTVAGDPAGATGSAGDGGAPAAATFKHVSGIAQAFDPLDPSADVLAVVDDGDFTVRFLNFSEGTVTLKAGAHGQAGFNGDDGNTPGLLGKPTSFIGTAGVLFLADAGNQRIRRIFVQAP